MAKKTGKAYAFFDCKSSKESIEEELPHIRECVKTPGELEISLMQEIADLTADSQLLQIAKEAKSQGRNYIMEATYPNRTNRQTADELASILNQAYQSPLFQKREQFKGKIVYKEKDYVFRE